MPAIDPGYQSFRKTTARKPGGPMPRPADSPAILKELYAAGKIELPELEERLEKCLG